MKKALLIAGLALSLGALAQPSMYYWWVNVKTGQKVCEPETPGKDWKKASETVYQDFECKNPL